MRSIASLIFASLLSLNALAQGHDPIIGEALGKPIHASQIKVTDERERAEALRSLFISPAISGYLESHKSEVLLTEEELKAFTNSYNALIKCKPELGLQKMDPPFDKVIAQMMVGSVKAQRLIYLNYGRGRLLFQQAGLEAFDATHRLILDLEQNGKFKFKRPTDRALALSYWTTQDHSSFLQPDPGPDKAFQLDALMLKCTSG